MAGNLKVILSIDGGGVKGVIPICLPVKLEEETGKLSQDIFFRGIGKYI